MKSLIKAFVVPSCFLINILASLLAKLFASMDYIFRKKGLYGVTKQCNIIKCCSTRAMLIVRRVARCIFTLSLSVGKMATCTSGRVNSEHRDPPSCPVPAHYNNPNCLNSLTHIISIPFHDFSASRDVLFCVLKHALSLTIHNASTRLELISSGAVMFPAI